MLTKVWNAEPLLISVLGSQAVWQALYGALVAFHVPVTSTQWTALSGLVLAVSAIVARQHVTPTNGGGQ